MAINLQIPTSPMNQANTAGSKDCHLILSELLKDVNVAANIASPRHFVVSLI